MRSLAASWSTFLAIIVPSCRSLQQIRLLPSFSIRMSKRSSSEATKQQASLSSFFQPSKKRTKVTAASTATSSDATSSRKYIIYCDLDGVLVDFDAGVKKLFPNSPSVEDIPSKVLWPKLAKTPQFYQHLPWMSDGQHLWKSLMHMKQHCKDNASDTPTIQLRILTGCPMFASAATDKYQWCRRELGLDTVHIPKTGPKAQQRDVLKQCHNKIQVVTCRSKEKHLQSGLGWCVL
jgi:hypothetical protein